MGLNYIVIPFNQNLVCIILKKTFSLKFYIMDTKNSTMGQIYEIENEYKFILAESIILPDSLLNKTLTKRGLIFMDERLEWSVVGFREIKEIQNFDEVILPLFEGKLPSKPKGITLTKVPCACISGPDISLLCASLFEDHLSLFTIRKNEYIQTDSHKVDIKHLLLSKVSYQVPENGVITEISLGWKNKNLKINLMYELSQQFLDCAEPKLCQKGISLLEYDFKNHELIASPNSIENLTVATHFQSIVGDTTIFACDNKVFYHSETEDNLKEVIAFGNQMQNIALIQNFDPESSRIFLSTTEEIVTIKSQGGKVTSQKLLSVPKFAYGKKIYLLETLKKDNQTIMRILTFLNKQDIRILTLNLSSQQVEKILTFAITDSKCFHQIEVMQGYSNRINCIKSSKYFSTLKTYYHINEASILSSKSLNNDLFLTIMLKACSLFYLQDNNWLVSSPCLSVSKTFKVTPQDNPSIVFEEKSSLPFNLSEHTYALNYFTPESFFVQVTQPCIQWIFPGKNQYEVTIKLGDLIGVDDYVLSSAAANKSNVYMAIHNQLHILYFRGSLAQKTKETFQEKLKPKIIKCKEQIKKVWVMNDFNIVMLQFYNSNTLFLYKIREDGKDMKLLNQIECIGSTICSVVNFTTMYNGTNLNTFLISYSNGELQFLHVSNDIMNNKSDDEYYVSISQRKKIFDTAITLFPLNNHLPFNAAQAEKFKEEYHLLASSDSGNYLLGFQKCAMSQDKEFYPNIRILKLSLEKVPSLVIPYERTDTKINALCYIENQNCLNALSIQLKSSYQTKLFETDKKILTSLQIGNYTAVITSNIFNKKIYLELINGNYQQIEELELPSDYRPRSMIYMEKLNFILIAGYRTVVRDEAPNDLYSEKFKKEHITLISVISLSGIPLGPTYDFCSLSKDQYSIILPNNDGSQKGQENLCYNGNFKLNGEIQEIQSIADNYLLLRKLDSITLLRIYNKPFCLEVLSEFFIYNKSIEDIRGELSVEDLDYFISQKLIENNIAISSTLLYKIKPIGTNTGVYIFWLCLLTRNGEFHLVEFSTDKKAFKPLSVMRGFEECDKIFGKDNNKILLRQLQTDIIEITIEEEVVSREFSEEYVFQITKKSIYSGSGKILSVSPGSLSSTKEISFDSKEKYEEILSISEDTGKHFEAPKKKLSEIINLMYL